MTTLTSGILSGSILQEQLELEDSSSSAGVTRYRDIVQEAQSRGNAAKLRPVERFIAFWFPAVIQEVKRLRRFYINNRNRGHVGSTLVAPIIIASDPERLAAVAISQAFNVFLRADEHREGSPIVMHRDLAYSIGKTIIAQLHADELSRNHKKAWKTLCNRFANITPALINTFARKTLDEHWFNLHVCASLGSTMTNVLLGACAIEIEVDKKTRRVVSAFRFYRERRYVNGSPRDFRLAAMHPRVMELIERGHSIRQSFRPIYLPMVVAPYPWMVDPEPDQEGRNGQIGGGYIKIRTPFTTRPSIDQREAMEQADLTGIYEGVNAVSATAYKINSRLIVHCGFFVNMGLIMLMLRSTARALEKGFQAIYLGFCNRILGGAVMGALAVVIYSVLLWFSVKVSFINEATISQSRTYPLLKDVPGRAKTLAVRLKPFATEMWDESLKWMDNLDEYGIQKTETQPKVYEVPEPNNSGIEEEPEQSAPRQNPPAAAENSGIEE